MSWAIWITGLPGSGKSVLARATAAELRAGGEPVVVLELDAIRKIVTPSPTYSDTERDVVYHALVYMAAVLTESGTPVIIDATAHRSAWRATASHSRRIAGRCKSRKHWANWAVGSLLGSAFIMAHLLVFQGFVVPCQVHGRHRDGRCQ